MKRKLLAGLLAVCLMAGLSVPALAAGNGIAVTEGHEILSRLPATLQKPARPTTLEQAENRVNSGGWWYPPEWDLTPGKEETFREIEALAESLTAGKATDTEKAKAIFDWVSQNIKYDYTAYQYYVWRDAGRWLTDEQTTQINKAADPFYAYAQRLAICDGYSDLSWLMLSMVGIPAARISGDSNERGLNGGGPHAWNATLVDGKWVFFDSTWKMWDIAPNYHKTSGGIAFCDGAFQQTSYYDSLDGSFPVSYWLCPGYECPANVVIPEGCWDVMAESFKGCTTLKSITLPSTCTIIQTEAFQGCTGLESITIPANVKQVNWRAFQGCTSLKNVTFQNKSVDVWENAFDGTPMVEDAKEFAIVGGVLVKYKGDGREVTIPGGVTALAERAFSSNQNAKFYMTKVVIPEGVTLIGKSAFSGCRMLADITIPKSIKTVKDFAFDDTAWLKNQADFAMVGTTLLTYQGKDVKTIEHLVVPDGVTEIAARAFFSASAARKITLPASLTKIGEWAFNHSYLEEVVFKGTQAQWDAVEIVPDGGTNWRFRNVYDPENQAVVRCTGVAPNIAYPSTQTVDVDGKKVEFQCYALKDANGNDTNYIKLRDLADILNGSAAQFQVGWDGNITITTGAAYTKNGTEQSTPFSGQRSYEKTAVKTLVDGVETSLDTFQLKDDNGGGYTYYKLRDLGKALGITVDWSGERGIYIETK